MSHLALRGAVSRSCFHSAFESAGLVSLDVAPSDVEHHFSPRPTMLYTRRCLEDASYLALESAATVPLNTEPCDVEPSGALHVPSGATSGAVSLYNLRDP